MRQKIIAGNWKMNGQLTSIEALLNELLQLWPSSMTAECIIMPPAIYLPLVSTHLSKSAIHWGAQNVYPKDFGAYTGELSGPMLKDYGCNYILVGHSERRTLFNEDEKFVADKFHHVKDHGMIPVLCVGETLKEREEGETEHVLAKQLCAIAERDARAFSHCVVAYEPVWAIGTGHTASPEQAQLAHTTIRSIIAKFSNADAATVPLLYGGSVNEKNAEALFAMPDVDGGLIGGASLNARQFVEIIKCIN
ncbi:triosephosphate isomerase [Legionella beliardensis]|uniref:Triosephosphate isomerase n=1 Tax=Legionella beliardensis TaxID=91822 RepID=A0A378I5G7_9GAMM|nr:triose-phosphate isomerase [Legionella beliardensis]STX30092.1 triosephosphate isomerase [Legionella beliardensis]